MIVKIYSVNLYCNIYKIQLNFLRGKNENENYLVIQLYFVYVSAQVYCKFMLSTLIFFSLWIRRQLVVKRKVTDKKVLQLVVKVLDSHCPVNLCSNLLVNSFPFFWGGKGAGQDTLQGSRVQNHWVAPRLTLLLLLLSLIKWILGTSVGSLQKVKKGHTKGHKVLQSFFCYSFSTFCFSQKQLFILRII